jgi:uncharacterized protein
MRQGEQTLQFYPQGPVQNPPSPAPASPKSPQPWPQNAPTRFHVLAKPTGAICNLDCKYCFFLSKETLYPDSRFRMPDEVLEAYIRQLIESQPAGHITVAWQGGEPTLMGLPFFQRAMALIKKYARPGMTFEHTVQTNGTLLNDQWCEFFRENGFLVGLSMDGPRDMHDAYRVDKLGRPTFEKVRRAARLMGRHGVEFNILCTVHAANVERPLRLYRFFRDELKARFIQFIPIVERVTPEIRASADEGWGDRKTKRPFYSQQGDQVTERSVRPEQWGRFLTTIFDEWVHKDVGRVFVQLFDSALASWARLPPAMCIFSETCGNAVALEHNGDLYACDHYVEPEHLLGNITETHMVEMLASDKQRAFGNAKRDTLPRYCRECEVRFACNGECPRNRFIDTPDGEPGLNYLCAGYKAFFHHIDRPMQIMAQLLRIDRPPAEVMRILKREARSKGK